MDDPASISRSRRLYQNPYAHIESIELDDLSRSRVLLQNQYAHIEQIESDRGEARRRDGLARNSFEEIEGLVISLQRDMWKQRAKLWPNYPNILPLEVLDPAVAASILGFNFEEVTSLGYYVDRSEHVAVAGLINRSQRSIKISQDLDYPSRNFTAAHEVGHAALHPHLNTLHRDRPLDGSNIQRDRVELEADKFATYFLLPKTLVSSEFERRFHTKYFALNENTGFGLFRLPFLDIPSKYKLRRNLARLLASANEFNGKQFISLAKSFGVSIEAMAIRIEELNFV